MADTKISDLTALTGADAATTDVFPVVDVSANTTKKMTRAEMFQNTPPIAVTGTLSAGGTTNLSAGTMAAPGLVLEGETGTGLYRIGANNHGYAVSGAKVLDIASSGVTIFESFNAQTTSGLFGVSAYGGSSVKLTSSATMAYEVGASFEHQMRVNSVTVGSFSSTGLTLGAGVNLVMASATTVRLGGYTVATLPAAGTAGRTAYVTDATAPTYLGALTGGGAVVCPVFDNGVAWVSA